MEPIVSKRASQPTPVKRTWIADFLASIVVFMVALPLCVAIAEACGYPPEAGVITGVIGGIVVGMLSGSPLQVSGPAAGLIVVVQDQVREFGIAGVGLILILAGFMQVVMGLLRLGRWFRAVSPAVVLGMLAGIGLIILSKQFHVLFDTKAPSSFLEALLTAPGKVIQAFSQPTLSGPAAAGIVGAVTILIMALWKSVAPRRLKFIPAAVVAVVAASLLAGVAGWDVKKIAISGLIGELTQVPEPPWAKVFDPRVWGGALTIALIASAETLLCATAVDTKHTGPRTRFNQELLAQGAGNVMCGVLGALPMTGVIVRSSANLDAGAKTRWSTILHGVWLLLFVAFLDDVLAQVPLAVLAGVLVYTGWKLLGLTGAVQLWRTSKTELVVYLITCTAIVATDLLTGVLIGLGVSAGVLLNRFSHLEIRREIHPSDNRVTLYLEGAATFIRLPKLAAVLESLPPDAELRVHFEELTYIDHACLELLINWEKQREATGGSLEIDWEGLEAKFHQAEKNGPIGSNGRALRTEQRMRVGTH